MIESNAMGYITLEVAWYNPFIFFVTWTFILSSFSDLASRERGDAPGSCTTDTLPLLIPKNFVLLMLTMAVRRDFVRQYPFAAGHIEYIELVYA